ncbi:MAG: DUF2334 domain-containing protein [Thermodesulfobacteriota bacterium]
MSIFPSLKFTHRYKRYFILTLTATILLTCFSIIAEANKSTHHITVVFRYDDYCSRTDTELEKKIIADFKKHQICCTFGVIPFVKAKNYLQFDPQEVIPLTPEKIALARDAIKAGAMDAAQHGYSHQTLQTKGWHTEFQTLDYDTQLEKIRTGKVFLEKVLSTPITTFIPPYNSYDAITLEALENLNFQCLSASMNGEIVPSASLKILPGTCGLEDFKETVEYARKIVEYDPIICVVFHQYVFTDVEMITEYEDINYKIPYEKFSDLLNWVTSQKDIRVRSIDQVVKENVDLSMERFINNKYYLQLVHLKPAWWPPHYGIYLPSAIASHTRIRNFGAIFNIPRMRNVMYIASFYGLILFIAFISTYIIGSMAFAVAGIMDKVCKYFSIVMACILISYLAFSSKIQYKKLEILVGLWGLGLGGWLLFIRRKKFTDSKNKR